MSFECKFSHLDSKMTYHANPLIIDTKCYYFCIVGLKDKTIKNHELIKYQTTVISTINLKDYGETVNNRKICMILQYTCDHAEVHCVYDLNKIIFVLHS